MLPPCLMLTTKKWGLAPAAAAVAGWMLILGCTPSGPRALLDGQHLRQTGKFSEAVEKLTLATSLIPTNALAWHELGLAAQSAGQAATAVRAYRQALTLTRDSDLQASARYNLGCLYLDQTNFPAAVDELKAYTLLQPQAVEGWYRLGLASLRARKFDDAEKILSYVLKAKPGSPEVMNSLGYLLVQRRRYIDAYNYFANALRFQSNYPPAQLNLAIVEHRFLNNHLRAMQQYQEYAALRPAPPYAALAEDLARQLHAELYPPPRGPLTNLLTQAAAPTNSAVTNLHAAPTNALKPNVAAHPPATNAAPPARMGTNFVTPLPPYSAPRPVTQAAPPPVTNVPPSAPPKEQPATEAPAKVEVVQLPEDPTPKPARDIATAKPLVTNAPSAPTTSPNQSPSTPSTPPTTTQSGANPTQTGSTTTKPAERGFVQKLDPRNWFRSRDKEPLTTTPLPIGRRTNAAPAVVAAATNPPPATNAVATPDPAAAPNRTPLPPVPFYARYKYARPAAPAPGNRAAAQPFFEVARKAELERRYADAAAAYRQAAQADPSLFEAQYDLGLAAYRAGDLPSALEAGELALAIDPASVNARFNFALTLEKANYPRDAANELERVLTDTPTDVRAHLVAANLYAQRLGQPDLARQHYQKVLALEPDHPQAVAIRSWLSANPL